MTEISEEERAAKAKAAVDAMKNAKSNITVALDRIGQLERALADAICALRTAKEDISSKVYCYPISDRPKQTVHERIDATIANLSKVL